MQDKNRYKSNLGFVSEMVEKILEKNEKILFTFIFFFLPKCFQKDSCSGSLTLSRTTNFGLFQTKRVCRQFLYHVNGGKFSKGVENTVEKGEISIKKYFLLFPQGFQKTCIVYTKNKGMFGKGISLFHITLTFTTLKKRTFKTLWEKEKMLATSTLSFFPPIFSTFQTEYEIILSSTNFKCLQLKRIV